MTDEKYWVWLSRIENLNKRKLDMLLERYVDVSNLWNVKKENDLAGLGITQNLATKIVSKEYKEDIDKYIEYMHKNQIELITFDSKYYPKKLREIYDPPVSIYISGNKEILNDLSVAIIGCRECTSYGKIITQKFAYAIARANINIVSGLARGIDTCSHIGAIKASGKTISVIGSGLDIIYPPENLRTI